MEESVLNVQVFDEDSRFKTYGGFAKINKVFQNLSLIHIYETLPEDDPDNYYMEREWRCIHNIKFDLSDIKKIYLKSERYKEKFVEHFPAYKGEFYVFEEK